MKKMLAFTLAAIMMLSLVACGGNSSVQTEKPSEEPEVEAPAETPVETPATEAEYKLGMGVMLNTDSSATEKAQVDATMATVVLDADGKIVLCRIDCVQNKMDIVGGTVDTAKEFQTKMELGDAYGMVAYGNAIAEWDAQTKAFEEYVVGMTAAEVEAIATTTNDHGYTVPADEALYAGCTMQISEFMAAVVKACKDDKGQTFKTGDTFTLGAAAISEASESSAAAADADGVVKMYSEYGAAVVGADGKILACLNDATQPKININTAGEIVSSDYKGTKRELGDAYGMVAFGNAIAEWDAQSAAFSEYAVGMTAAEVMAIETTENDHGYQVPADEALYAGCTMQITGMMAVIARAAEYAR